MVRPQNIIGKSSESRRKWSAGGHVTWRHRRGHKGSSRRSTCRSTASGRVVNPSMVGMDLIYETDPHGSSLWDRLKCLRVRKSDVTHAQWHKKRFKTFLEFFVNCDSIDKCAYACVMSENVVKSCCKKKKNTYSVLWSNTTEVLSCCIGIPLYLIKIYPELRCISLKYIRNLTVSH